MKYSEAYKNTLQAYRAQGSTYPKGIADLTPPLIYDFIKLLPQGGKILDVGCAGGRDSKTFVDNGFDVFGIDVIDEFLDEARRKAPEAEFQNMDLLKLDFSDGSFDGIWSYAVLLHIQKSDIPGVLDKYSRILKPSGKLFIGVKKGQGSAYVTDKLSKEKRFFVYYEEDELREILENHGFQIVKLETEADRAGRTDTTWIMVIAEKV